MSLSSVRTVVLAAVLPVTVTVALLLAPPPLRGPAFFLSVAFLLVAEALALAYPTFLPRHEADLPVRLGAGAAIGIYCFGVLALVVSAAAGMPFRLLLAGHLLWLLLLAVVLVMHATAAQYVREVAAADDASREPMWDARQRMLALCDRLDRVASEQARSTSPCLRELAADLRYRTSESSPACLAADEALTRSVDAVEEAVRLFETLPVDGHGRAVESLAQSCVALRAAMRVREDAIAHSAV
jgi:hypothetical protein